MSSILFLTTDDFTINQGEKGPILCHEIRGFSFIMFYSTHCVFCQQILPLFKTLPEYINGCQFGMINVSTNRQIVSISRQTITPLNYVPLLILYINGRPYMRYDGEPDAKQIRHFILSISNMVQESGFAKVAREKNMAEIFGGVPLYGENDICYLEFDGNIYKQPKNKKNTINEHNVPTLQPNSNQNINAPYY